MIKTIIQIIKVTWPLIKQGVVEKQQVRAYLSRRKFTTFMLIAMVFMLSGISFMTEQANYHRKQLSIIKEQYDKSLVDNTALKNENDLLTKQVTKYKAEIIRLDSVYEIESPLIIKNNVMVKD